MERRDPEGNRAVGEAHGGAAAPSRPPRASDLPAERARLERLLTEERRARAEGFRLVAGVDEVGRGCLAGPVCAGAVLLDPESPILGLNDSKRLAPEVRADLAAVVRRKAIAAGLGWSSPAEIDCCGIAEATRLAMLRALAELAGRGLRADLVLVDGHPVPGGLGPPQRAFVGGDGRVAAIAAASVLAKVARDARMESEDRLRPWYGFAAHKGYGTPEHLRALRRHGPSVVHRLSFAGVLPAGPARPRRAA